MTTKTMTINHKYRKIKERRTGWLWSGPEEQENTVQIFPNL